MLPDDGRFSTTAHGATYYAPDNLSGFTRQVDYERGGVALHDASRGLRYQNWKLAYDHVSKEVVLTNESGFLQVMFTSIGLTQLAIAFDLSMTPYIAYTEKGVTWLRWVMSNGTHVKMVVPGATQPRLTLDDRRPGNEVNSDVVLFYLKGNQLCKRYLRDRFEDEYIMADGVDGTRLGRVGMTTGNRVQVEVLP